MQGERCVQAPCLWSFLRCGGCRLLPAGAQNLTALCLAFADGAIAHAVRRCKNLQELNLVGCRYGDETAEAVCGLACLRVLCVQDTSGVALTDHGRSLIYSLPPTVVVAGLALGWVSLPGHSGRTGQ